MGDGGTGEKTEEATPQRLQEARKKGQVSKSQDVLAALGFMISFVVLALTMEWTLGRIKEFIIASIYAGVSDGGIPAVINLGFEALMFCFVTCMPVLGAAFIVGLAANYLQVGFLFTTHPIKPDIKKINPISGLKQMFSKKRLFELIKQIVKFTVVTYVCYRAVLDNIRDIVVSQRVPLESTIKLAGQIIWDLGLRVGVLFIVIAAADFLFQRWQFKKDMMMSKYDVKQEYKQSEGDPEMKSHRKALAEELIMHGSQENVRNADAVVTNPAHIAVAIKYDQEKGGAPKIVAKGMRKHADKIKEIARQFNVPVMRNVPLAQALNKLEIGEEIPEELYEAVAEVLNFVYELQQKKKI
ncbi:MAG: type III secretion system export apparatus subunit SctU [Deltaproteobacteria bacterium]|nr:type III secretion system export apparatus subunit SctU [Deltaproteobacteria bacterium]